MGSPCNKGGLIMDLFSTEEEPPEFTLEAAREVRKAWELFMTGDETLLGKVRPAIRKSWQRSRQFGVDPTPHGNCLPL